MVCTHWVVTESTQPNWEDRQLKAVVRGTQVRVPQSCWTLCDPMDYAGVGSLSHLQRIFPTQGLNPGLPHCREILYQLSHKGSPKILKWVAYSFSIGYSWPRNQTGVSWIADRFFTNWAIREAQNPMNTTEITRVILNTLYRWTHLIFTTLWGIYNYLHSKKENIDVQGG